MKVTRLATRADVDSLISWHNEHSGFVSLDTETTGLDPFTDKLTMIVMSDKDVLNESVVFDPAFATAISNLKTTQVYHNFKFDLNFLERVGVTFDYDKIRDTILMHHLIDEDAPHDLDTLVKEYYGDSYKEEFWGKHTSFGAASEAEQQEYAGKDAIYTAKLYDRFAGDPGAGGALKTTPSLATLHNSGTVRHVHALATELFRTERAGVRVDTTYLADSAAQCSVLLRDLHSDILLSGGLSVKAFERELWAREINKLYRPGPRARAWKRVECPKLNISSHKQLQEFLYDFLKLPEQTKYDKKTKSNKRTTDDDALAKIDSLHPIVPALRKYAEHYKVFGSFIEGTAERLQGGRIYPTFNVNGTVTGRISSSNPNLQNIPSQGEWAKIRGVYIPDEGNQFITADYAMLEVVIAAHFSQDPNLLKIIFEGASKHDITANALGIPRSLAKTLNFAMQYQCTDRKVKQLVGCSDKEATAIWDKYWETYAGEKLVIEECKRKVDNAEPIVNPFGRLRHFNRVGKLQWQRESAYRQAYSSLIQGTGADCTHYSYYTLGAALREKGWGRVVWQVHDEIILEVPKEHVPEAREMVKAIMVSAGEKARLSVPLSVDVSQGLDRWEK